MVSKQVQNLLSSLLSQLAGTSAFQGWKKVITSGKYQWFWQVVEYWTDLFCPLTIVPCPITVKKIVRLYLLSALNN